MIGTPGRRSKRAAVRRDDSVDHGETGSGVSFGVRSSGTNRTPVDPDAPRSKEISTCDPVRFT